jgi:hypothetical protein
MSDTFRTINGNTIFWRDKKGVVHRCEGADVHRGVRLLWTLCKRDVPANAAYTTDGPEFVTCQACSDAENGKKKESVDAARDGTNPSAGLRSHLSPERRRGLENAIERIIQDACELPDRTSPEDQPDMLLITGEELDMLLRRHLGLEDDDLRSLSPSSEGGSPR